MKRQQSFHDGILSYICATNRAYKEWAAEKNALTREPLCPDTPDTEPPSSGIVDDPGQMTIAELYETAPW